VLQIKIAQGAKPGKGGQLRRQGVVMIADSVIANPATR